MMVIFAMFFTYDDLYEFVDEMDISQ